ARIPDPGGDVRRGRHSRRDSRREPTQHARRNMVQVLYRLSAPAQRRGTTAVKAKRELAHADADTIPCVVCREPIRRGAHRCIHCQSAQDWTRYVARWSSFWTAVLALVPLWSGALALRQLAFPDHRPNVRIRPIACTEQGLVLAITNSGKGPGLFGESTLRVEVGGQAASETFALMPAADQRIAMPDTTSTLRLEPRSG